jgi:hypothetical protein
MYARASDTYQWTRPVLEGTRSEGLFVRVLRYRSLAYFEWRMVQYLVQRAKVVDFSDHVELLLSLTESDERKGILKFYSDLKSDIDMCPLLAV